MDIGCPHIFGCGDEAMIGIEAVLADDGTVTSAPRSGWDVHRLHGTWMRHELMHPAARCLLLAFDRRLANSEPCQSQYGDVVVLAELDGGI
jgi:hypothetical protein